MTFAAAASSEALPVVCVIRKRVPAAKKEAFAEWQSRVGPLAEEVLGKGKCVVTYFHVDDTTTSDSVYHVVATFKDKATVDLWDGSSVKKEWLESGADLQSDVGKSRASVEDFLGLTPAVVADPKPHHPPFHKSLVSILFAVYPTLLVVTRGLVPVAVQFAPALHELPQAVFLFGTCCCVVSLMLSVSMPASVKLLGFFLKPGGDTLLNTLLVVLLFASTVLTASLGFGDLQIETLTKLISTLTS